MIHDDSYTLDWIQEKSKENYKADPILVEKVIRAFSLLEHLQQSEVNFIFKGGTSLMLLLDEPRRLSIDVDIIIPGGKQNLDPVLEEIQKSSPFIDRELIERKQAINIQKQHFKVYYEPAYKTGGDREHILLDILFEENPYSELVDKEIASSFIKIIDPPVTIKVPSIKSILADKLTAYPPNTTGIPYIKNGNGMGLQIIKQLFDIARLTDQLNDLYDMKPDFDRIVQSELEYRDLSELTSNDVLDDIVQTSLCISSRGTAGKGDFKELMSGIQRILSFIFSDKHNIDKATVDSAKAAYVAACLRTGTTEMEKFESPEQVTDLSLAGDYPKIIHKYRKSNPESFFYWYQVSNLLNR